MGRKIWNLRCIVSNCQSISWGSLQTLMIQIDMEGRLDPEIRESMHLPSYISPYPHPRNVIYIIYISLDIFDMSFHNPAWEIRGHISQTSFALEYLPLVYSVWLMQSNS